MHARIPNNDASTAISFVTAPSETEAYTISQESQTSLKDGSNILGIFEESDGLVEDLADNKLLGRYPNKRKRRNTDATSEEAF